MQKQVIYFILVFGIACQKNIPKQNQQILALKNLSDLATVEYTISKVIKASDNKTWYKIGDRKILITCEATIKAGIDLKDLDAKNVTINNNNINLNLPHSKIISFNMPAEKIKVAYQSNSPLRSDFNAAEKADLLTQGEAQIKEQIDEIGILKEAEKNTTLFVTNFLMQAGYKTVTITYGVQPINNLLK